VSQREREREREQQRRPVSQCMGRAAGSQGIEWHRLRPPLEGVVVLGEWRSCSAELAKQRRRERERLRLAVGGVSRAEQGRGERGEVEIHEQRREMEFVEREWLASFLWMMDSESFLPSSSALHGCDLWERKRMKWLE